MKIFDRAKDKNVAAVVIEAATEGYVYSGTETEVAEADYFDLFIHGVVKKVENAYVRAIAFDGEDFVWAELGE